MYRVRLQRWIQCPECGVKLVVGSMMEQRQCMHRTKPAINWSRLPVNQIVHQTQVYDVRFPRTKSIALAPSLDARDIPERGTAYTLTSKGITRGIRSGYWRSTPTPSLCKSAAGDKLHQGGSVTSTTCRRSVIREKKGDSGVRPYNAALSQVGYRSRSTTRPYHSWRHYHTWGGRWNSTTTIGMRYI